MKATKTLTVTRSELLRAITAANVKGFESLTARQHEILAAYDSQALSITENMPGRDAFVMKGAGRTTSGFFKSARPN